MTVIAIKNGIMAADSAVWQGQIIAGHMQKVRRLNDGRLFGGCGETAAVLACAAWLNDAAERPVEEKDTGFHALILGPEGIDHIDGRFRVYSIDGETMAVCGAHNDFLRGALLAGLTAEEAVRLAIKYGDSAGGEVQVERL